MSIFQVLNVARRVCPSASPRTTALTNSFRYQFLLRRHASFYNADVAGLTEEEAEVNILEYGCDNSLTVDLCSSVTQSLSSQRKKSPHALQR